MTPQQLVRKMYPKARVCGLWTDDYVIYIKDSGMGNIGRGKSKRAAWRDALDRISAAKQDNRDTREGE